MEYNIIPANNNPSRAVISVTFTAIFRVSFGCFLIGDIPWSFIFESWCLVISLCRHLAFWYSFLKTYKYPPKRNTPQSTVASWHTNINMAADVKYPTTKSVVRDRTKCRRIMIMRICIFCIFGDRSWTLVLYSRAKNNILKAEVMHGKPTLKWKWKERFKGWPKTYPGYCLHLWNHPLQPFHHSHMHWLCWE